MNESCFSILFYLFTRFIFLSFFHRYSVNNIGPNPTRFGHLCDALFYKTAYSIPLLTSLTAIAREQQYHIKSKKKTTKPNQEKEIQKEKKHVQTNHWLRWPRRHGFRHGHPSRPPGLFRARLRRLPCLCAAIRESGWYSGLNTA